MVSRLSQEITDYVLDYLHGDAASLRSSALTCKSWLRTSQLHLFCFIDLVKSQKGITFVSVITESPHLAKYVRVLWLAETAEDRWLASPTHGLLALAPIFPRVIDLTMRGVDWATLSDETLSCLRDGCRAVRTLRMDNCHFASPSSFCRAFIMFSRLQILRVLFASIDQSSEEAEAAAAGLFAEDQSEIAPRAALTSLSFVSDTKFSPPLSLLLEVFDFSKMVRLNMIGGLERITPFVNEACRSAGESLLYLTISDFFNISSAFIPASISCSY